MKTFLIILLSATLTFGLGNCKKEDEPKTGSIKIVFSGTPTQTSGETVTFSFAKDLANFNQKIYSFTKQSKKPHVEILISDVDPIEWYILQEQSSGSMGPPWPTNATIKVEAGKTSTLTFTFQ